MILTRTKELSKLVDWLPGKTRMGFVSGCWDLTHGMHNNTFRRCRRKCDFLIVGVDACDLVHENKGSLPTTPCSERMRLIADLVSVDAVIEVNSLRHHNEICDQMDIVFKNSHLIYGKKVKHGGAKLVIIPDVEICQSTTQIKQKIAWEDSGNCDNRIPEELKRAPIVNSREPQGHR